MGELALRRNGSRIGQAMMPKLIAAGISAFAGLGLGCDEISEKFVPSTSTQASICLASPEYAEQSERANSAILQALESIHAPCLVHEHEGGPCELVRLKFEPAKRPLKKSQQRILIMDGGMTLPALTRYRSRVIDFLEYDEVGKLHRVNEEVVIPKLAQQILVDILDKEFPELPPCLLKPVQKSFELKLSESINAYNNADHGDVIFTKLAELNPNAQFVLVRDLKASINAEDCADWEAMMQKRTQLAIAEQKSLEEIIKRYEITHINFSFSPTFEHRFENIKKSCPNLELTKQMVQRTIEDDRDLFFEPIFSLPGLISAQAIYIEGNYESDSMRQLSAVDCTSIPRRLRIGAFGVSNSGLPVQGANTFDLFQNRSKASAPCVDLAINLGSTQFNEGPHSSPFVYFSWTGIETGPGFNVGSSWAAPLALSYLIYLQQVTNANGDDLIRLATNDGLGRLKDPVRHKQFEIFRLGYLK